jgi:iron complex transport system permease protein
MELSSGSYSIVNDVRLPRILVGLLVGAALSTSGATLQGIFRNPLADPAIIGVTVGGSLGAVIAIYFGLTLLSPALGPLMGMMGGLAACALTFALGRGGTVALVLAGAAVSSLTAAGIALALNFAPNPYAAYEIMTWLLGSLADKSWSQVLLILLMFVGRLGPITLVSALALRERQHLYRIPEGRPIIG